MLPTNKRINIKADEVHSSQVNSPINSRFFDRTDYSEKLRAEFKLTNVHFLQVSQFGYIYIGYKSKKEKIDEETCLEKGKKKYVLKVFQQEQ